MIDAELRLDQLLKLLRLDLRGRVVAPRKALLQRPEDRVDVRSLCRGRPQGDAERKCQADSKSSKVSHRHGGTPPRQVRKIGAKNPRSLSLNLIRLTRRRQERALLIAKPGLASMCHRVFA